MKKIPARFILTPAPSPTENPMPFIKVCGNCQYAQLSSIDPTSEAVCTLWKLRVNIEGGCTAFLADKEEYYNFWRDTADTSLHPSPKKNVAPISNAVNCPLMLERARRGDRAFGIAVGYPYDGNSRQLERWEN